MYISKCKFVNNIFSDGNYYFLDTLIRDYDNIENMKSEVKFFGGAVSGKPSFLLKFSICVRNGYNNMLCAFSGSFNIITSIISMFGSIRNASTFTGNEKRFTLSYMVRSI